MELRLSVLLARSSVASRRGAEKLIAEGRVTVNGTVADRPSQRVTYGVDHIKVDGKRIRKPAPPVYLMLNKPTGCVTTAHDPHDRPTVFDFIRSKVMVEPVGRLDFDTEGLLLFTNDGDLAQKLMRPESKVFKTYKAKVHGHLSPNTLKELRQGVALDGITTLPAKVRKINQTPGYTWIMLTICEGKYRQVKRMMKRVGHPVARLKREIYGPLRLENLKVGKFRYLEPEEIEQLREAVR
jgi:23S rRNA pseudouridine2605 synthase